MDKETVMFILITIVTICTYISYAPQIVKILKTKSAADLSITSWLLWVITCVCYTGYALLDGSIGLIISCASELILCIIILYLSIKYRKK